MRAPCQMPPFVIPATTAIFALLPSVDSSRELAARSHRNSNNNIDKPSPHLQFQITLHGILLWASMGFLMPVGIIIIRMSNKEECKKKQKALSYIHAILQVFSLLLATTGAVMSIKYFGNSFSNTHQRIGLFLYVAIWLQALTGFIRPQRGYKGRSLWYLGHWGLGTGVVILGIINIYTGLYVFQARTSRSVGLFSYLFSAEVALIAFIFLLQDRWEYMQKQGVISGRKFYAVFIGRHPGVYQSWRDCNLQVNKYPGASFQTFDSLHEAEEKFFNFSNATDKQLPSECVHENSGKTYASFGF